MTHSPVRQAALDQLHSFWSAQGMATATEICLERCCLVLACEISCDAEGWRAGGLC